MGKFERFMNPAKSKFQTKTRIWIRPDTNFSINLDSDPAGN